MAFIQANAFTKCLKLTGPLPVCNFITLKRGWLELKYRVDIDVLKSWSMEKHSEVVLYIFICICIVVDQYANNETDKCRVFFQVSGIILLVVMMAII